MSEVVVTVVYAEPGRAIEIEVRLRQGASVADAIESSGIAARVPDATSAPVGIFGRRVQRDAPVAAGDRVEIYRSLVADAKTRRRQRAKRRPRS
jgi:putative ubiquitin-RnfH superfamily antitoxin RatB of RatAB toxin-antitoxin module